jgi:[acyl-carrier-protein] S-malonyltransferase
MSSYDVAWLFPGQGSQAVGMGWDLCRKFSPAEEIFDLAEDLSELPLKEASWRGPEDLLRQTEILQPALAAVSLGCVALLQDAGHRPAAVAGHSLGEFAALHAAGVLSVGDTLRLVIMRGRLMAEAASQTPGGMIAVKRLDVETVEAAVAELGPEGGVTVANYNAPTQIVLSGESQGLLAVTPLLQARGGEVVTLRVSGAWHSPLMNNAAARFAELLADTDFLPALVPVHLNALGYAETDPDRIKESMILQMTRPVHWCPIIEGMQKAGIKHFFEVGPGKVLRSLLRQILPDERGYTIAGIDGPKGLERQAVAPAELLR